MLLPLFLQHMSHLFMYSLLDGDGKNTPPSLPGLGVQMGRAGSVPKGRVTSTAAPRGSLHCAGGVNEQLPGALLLSNPLKL